MSKFKTGDKVHYYNANNIYIGVFKIIGIDDRYSEMRYYLEDDGNPEHYSINESQLRLADRFEKLGFVFNEHYNKEKKKAVVSK